MKTKLTLSIDRDLARAGSLWAATKGITLPRIYEQAIEKILEEEASPELRAWIKAEEKKKQPTDTMSTLSKFREGAFRLEDGIQQQ